MMQPQLKYETVLNDYREAMAASAKIYNLSAQSGRFKCGHSVTPSNEHDLGHKIVCKACRRKGLRSWLQDCKRRARIRRLDNSRAELIDRLKWDARQAPPGARLPLDVLLLEVANDFSMTRAELVGKKRKTIHTHARAVLIRVLRDRGMSYPQIGRVLGGRDHSTMIHARRSFDAYAKREPRVLKSYERLRDREASNAA